MNIKVGVWSHFSCTEAYYVEEGPQGGSSRGPEGAFKKFPLPPSPVRLYVLS